MLLLELLSFKLDIQSLRTVEFNIRLNNNVALHLVNIDANIQCSKSQYEKSKNESNTINEVNVYFLHKMIKHSYFFLISSQDS